jgi:hypothetical protein
MTAEVVDVPYRTLRLRSRDGLAETFHVRVPDTAVAEWLPHRAELRRRGYPDRPPDIDTPTLRAWLPRCGELSLPYFSDPATGSARPAHGEAFPVFMAVWQSQFGTAKVIVTGLGDGGFVSRVVLVNETGDCPVDKVHLLDPDLDPRGVWAEIETIVRALNEAQVGWGPGDPLVTTYPDFVALDAEVEVAEAEARAAGLLAPQQVH